MHVAARDVPRNLSGGVGPTFCRQKWAWFP